MKIIPKNRLEKLTNAPEVETDYKGVFLSLGVCLSEEQKRMIKRLHEANERNKLNDDTTGTPASDAPIK